MDYLMKYLKSKPKYDSIRSAKIAIVGLGSIGSLSAQLLSRCSLSNMLVADMDAVDKHNIQNQLYAASDIGKPKALALQEHVLAARPSAKIKALAKQITAESINELGRPDVILDCTDNMQARFLINDYCKSKGVAFLHSAASGADYQAAMFPYDGPCFRCTFAKNSTGRNCQEEGILPGVAQLAASIQTALCIRHLSTKKGEGIMIRGNMWSLDHSLIRLKKKADCPCCKGLYEFLNDSISVAPKKLCRSKSYLFSYAKSFDYLKKKFKGTKGFRNLKQAFMLDNATFFSDGRLLIRAESEAQAKKIRNQILK